MRMKITNWLFLFAWVILFACDTKGDFENEFKNYFIRYYGADGDQEAVDMHVNADGTVLILASNETTPGFKRIMLIKVDKNGEVLWEKMYGGVTPGVDPSEGPQDLELTTDGKFLILSNMYYGNNPSNNEGIFDFKVIRVNDKGEKIDSMVFGNNNGLWETQFMQSITAISDKRFIVTGNSTDESSYSESIQPDVDLEDLVTLGFDSTYTQLASLIPNTPGEQVGSGIKVFENPNASANRDFIWFCYLDQKPASHSSENKNFASYFLSINGSYIDIGEARFSGSGTSDEVLASVCQVPSALGGGFFEFGTSYPIASPTESSLYFCRRTADLSKTREGVINIAGNLTAVDAMPAPASDGFLILANEKIATGTTIRLAKINLSGTELWSANFGSFGRSNSGAKVTELSDGRILVLGTVQLETQKKIALLKVNRNGQFLN